MAWRHAMLAVAAALAVLGAAMVVDAQATLAQKRDEAAACEARTEGLGRLSCMDLSGIDAGIQAYFGALILVAALAFGAVAAWLAIAKHRLGAPRGWWMASGAAGALAALLAWTMLTTGLVTALFATAIAAFLVGAVAMGVVARQAMSSRTGS